MSTVPVTPPEELLLIPLAEVRTEQLLTFADDLALEPRYFGHQAVPRPSTRWRSVLCHPATVHGLAALVDGELVGVARLSPRSGGPVALYVAVAAPWRRQGVATRLVQAAFDLATRHGDAEVVAIAEHRKAPVVALAKRYAMAACDGDRGVEYRRRLAS